MSGSDIVDSDILRALGKEVRSLRERGSQLSSLQKLTPSYGHLQGVSVKVGHKAENLWSLPRLDGALGSRAAPAGLTWSHQTVKTLFSGLPCLAALSGVSSIGRLPQFGRTRSVWATLAAGCRRSVDPDVGVALELMNARAGHRLQGRNT